MYIHAACLCTYNILFIIIKTLHDTDNPSFFLIFFRVVFLCYWRVKSVYWQPKNHDSNINHRTWFTNIQIVTKIKLLEFIL